MSTSLSKAIAISAIGWQKMLSESCLLYTSDAADEL